MGGAVWLWKITTGERLALDKGQMDDVVNCLAFSADGQVLAAIASKGKARLWSVPERKPTTKMEAGASHLRTVTFSNDGASLIASSARRLKVCKWKTECGSRIPSFIGMSRQRPRICMTWVCADGNCLLALGFRFNVPQKYQKDPFSVPLPIGTCVAWWALREATLAVAENIADMSAASRPIYYLELWDALHERALSSITLGYRVPPALASSGDGHRALVAFHNGSVMLFGL
jgi:hypothetical protein